MQMLEQLEDCCTDLDLQLWTEIERESNKREGTSTLFSYGRD